VEDPVTVTLTIFFGISDISGSYHQKSNVLFFNDTPYNDTWIDSSTVGKVILASQTDGWMRGYSVYRASILSRCKNSAILC